MIWLLPAAAKLQSFVAVFESESTDSQAVLVANPLQASVNGAHSGETVIWTASDS